MGTLLRGLIRRLPRFFKRVVFIIGVLLLSIRDAFAVDLDDVVRNLRLFLGIALTLLGALSFASDRYCDGNASSYYACTRPSTYYYYPWWAIALVIIGSFLIVLWFLRRQQHS